VVADVRHSLQAHQCRERSHNSAYGSAQKVIIIMAENKMNECTGGIPWTKKEPRVMRRSCLVVGLYLAAMAPASFGFVTGTAATHGRRRVDQAAAPSACFMKGGSGNKEYSRDLLLREEAEAPFRKVRFFFYASLGGGALTSLLVSTARIAAGLSGINPDLLQESEVNAAVDLLGIVVLAALYKSDLNAEESRLKRASKGADFARLLVRGSKSMISGGGSGELLDSSRSDSFTTSLASLRRGRGIEKRVVIAIAGKDYLAEVLKEASALADSLVFNDLILVPVLMPSGLAPVVGDLPDCVALPVGAGWIAVVADEAEEAKKQGIDVEKEGCCVILKKNGRVGQRTKGIFLSRMVGDVSQRREMGMDVKNL
jgi:hypothetical protein